MYHSAKEWRRRHDKEVTTKIKPTSPFLLVILCLATAGRAFGDAASDFYFSGVRKQDAGDLQAAYGYYTMAIEIKPDYAFAYNNRGVVKHAMGNEDSALADETRAVRLNPKLPEARHNRGLLLRIKGDLDGALAEESKAIELKPDFPEAYYQRGLVKHDKGDLDAALADYTKAIDLKPDYAMAFNNRGEAEYAKGKLDGALADFLRATALKPDLADAFYGCGAVKQASGDVRGALVAYDKAIQLNPKKAIYYHSRGCLFYDNHDFDQALGDFRKAIELDETIDYSRFRVWLAMARLGQRPAATREMEYYLRRRTTGKRGDWESMVMHFLIGQLSERSFLNTATKGDAKALGKDCEAYFYAGSMRLIDGKKSTAEEYFKKSVATNRKDFMEYRSALAELSHLQQVK